MLPGTLDKTEVVVDLPSEERIPESTDIKNGTDGTAASLDLAPTEEMNNDVLAGTVDKTEVKVDLLLKERLPESTKINISPKRRVDTTAFVEQGRTDNTTEDMVKPIFKNDVGEDSQNMVFAMGDGYSEPVMGNRDDTVPQARVNGNGSGDSTESIPEFFPSARLGALEASDRFFLNYSFYS